MERVKGIRLEDSMIKKICALDPTGRKKFSAGLYYIIKFFFENNKGK
jgi:hypothetical protein